MKARAITTPALLSFLCGLALAVPAEACPQQTAKNSSPIVLAADEENEAVLEDLRPDEVPAAGEAAPPKASSEEEHGKHEKAGDLENEEIQQDMAPDTVPSGE
jgi:hypothetical protein